MAPKRKKNGPDSQRVEPFLQLPGYLLPDPTKAGCGCMLATILGILAVIVVVSNL